MGPIWAPQKKVFYCLGCVTVRRAKIVFVLHSVAVDSWASKSKRGHNVTGGFFPFYFCCSVFSGNRYTIADKSDFDMFICLCAKKH